MYSSKFIIHGLKEVSFRHQVSKKNTLILRPFDFVRGFLFPRIKQIDNGKDRLDAIGMKAYTTTRKEPQQRVFEARMEDLNSHGAGNKDKKPCQIVSAYRPPYACHAPSEATQSSSRFNLRICAAAAAAVRSQQGGQIRSFCSVTGSSVSTTDRSNRTTGSSYVESTTNESAALAAVANLCAQPLQCKTVLYSQPESWFDCLDQSHVTKLTIERVPLAEGAINDTVGLLVLPNDHNAESALDWPSFNEEKQLEALGRNIILTKGEPMVTLPSSSGGNPGACENVIKVLLRGHNVALVGHPGIGKSTELNALLLPLFQSLVDEKSPLKDVFQRSEDVLYRYRSVGGKIVCTEVAGAGESLADLLAFFRHYKNRAKVAARRIPRNDVVLVLEMSETETDPRFVHIPTVVALSARDVKTSLKTFLKTGQLYFTARPPHTEAELMVLATALFHSGNPNDRDELCCNMALPVGSSLAEVLGVVKKRIDIIGPLAREVLGTDAAYSLWVNAMETTENIGEFLDLRKSVNIFDLPQTAKYYVAPLPNSQNMILGRRSMELILEHARKANMATIRRMGLEWQLAEAVFLHYYLLGKANPHGGEHVPPTWNFRNWEFFKNPGPGQRLKAEHGLSREEADALRSEHTKQTQTGYFTTSVLSKSVCDLDPAFVYVSTTHSMPVGEAATVSADRAQLNLFQSSTVDPSAHPFSIRSLRRWVNGVKPERINVFFFTNWADTTTKGVTVTDCVDDDAVSVALFGQKGLYNSYIIRCGIYQNVARKMLAAGSVTFPQFLTRYTAAVHGGAEDQFRKNEAEMLSKKKLVSLAKTGRKLLGNKDCDTPAVVQKLIALLEDCVAHKGTKGSDESAACEDNASVATASAEVTDAAARPAGATSVDHDWASGTGK